MSKTKISWTDYSWNPTTGCKEISEGCANCYAKRFAERWRGIKGHAYEQGFDFKLHEDRLLIPYKWRKPRLVFVDSMSDLFFASTPDEFILKVFKVIEDTPRHTYQILTKRPERMVQWLNEVYKKPCPHNLWLGVSVENNDTVRRIELLKQTSAKIKFVSFEPLLSAIDLTPEILTGIHQAIVGGETGSKARLMKKEWVDPIFNLCRRLKISFFFKQWGVFDQAGMKVGKKKASNLYDGKIINEIPICNY